MKVFVDAVKGARGEYADWVAAFSELWRGGRSSADRFMNLMGPQIVLSAPGLRSTKGRAAGTAAFRRTFQVLPDLTADVHRWSATGDVLFIEMTFHATIGGRMIDWSNIDRFLFADGYAIERLAYFDPTTVRQAFLRTPAGWLQLLKRARRGM